VHRHLSAETRILSTKNGGGTGELYLSSNGGAAPATVKNPLKADSVRTGKVSKDGRRIRLVYAGEY
jgi:hypothetical protein